MSPCERLVIKDLQKRKLSFDSHKYHPGLFACYQIVSLNYKIFDLALDGFWLENHLRFYFKFFTNQAQKVEDLWLWN